MAVEVETMTFNLDLLCNNQSENYETICEVDRIINCNFCSGLAKQLTE